MNENLNTVPEDIREGCNLDKNVYGYLRKLEKEGVIEVERNGNKYLDIRLTKKGLRQLNDQMLAPYRSEIRNLVLRMDKDNAPLVEINDNLINFMLSYKPELLTFIQEVVVQEYSTVIPDNFSNVIFPKIEEFFDNKFDNKFINLNEINQK